MGYVFHWLTPLFDGLVEHRLRQALWDAAHARAARNWPTRLGLVAAGLGIALVPGFAAAMMPRGVSWVRVRDGRAGLRRSMWAVTGPDPNPRALVMVDALLAETDLH